ncbi:MAG TPA: sigma-70 family RNA polymerase sigma factor [Planctomycetota bacterium]|nr:sigma-70 family RNA polymerase sigma factor [Planctomycetota bacterium]
MDEKAPREPGILPAEEEAALVRGLRRGDAAAFETVVRRFGGPMLAVARRFLPQTHDAEDALQDAFLSAFKAFAGFEGGSRLSTWLHRIVVNAALMKLRSRRRKPEESIDDLLPTFREDGHAADHPVPGWRTSAEENLERQETRQIVRSCIDRLPESYRNVLLLRDIEGFDTAETARLLDVNSNVVKIRLHRARQALRTLLNPRFAGARTP